jgi:hypothetical protein
MFSKKKINIKTIIAASFIFLLSVPLRFLKLVYYFLVKNKRDFRDGMEILYTHSFFLLKNCKIEVLNNVIYLNCFTQKKLLNDLLGPQLNNQLISRARVLTTVKNLQIAVKEFDKYEIKNQEYTSLNLIRATDITNKLIYSPHYAILRGDNTLHVTSKIPKFLLPCQRVSITMPSAITQKAHNPGSIITTGVFKTENYPNKL